MATFSNDPNANGYLWDNMCRLFPRLREIGPAPMQVPLFPGGPLTSTPGVTPVLPATRNGNGAKKPPEDAQF